MKYLFIGVLGLLIAGSVVTAWLTPQVRSDVPVLYWVTDYNPARRQQVRAFEQWMRRNHPEHQFQLELDTANSDLTKKIIQGVSGVAADLIDVQGEDMPYLHAIGLLEDITDDAKEMGFGPEQTFAVMRPEITRDGRQFVFPANVWFNMYVVNRQTFAKYGLAAPPARWDFDTFERLGKQFVAAANAPGKLKVFFADSIEMEVLRRSVGLSIFNETLTASTLDDPRYVEILDRVYRWTYEDHLFPTAADEQSFAAAAGYGGQTPQLFNAGNYAMIKYGRHALIQLREFGDLDLSVSEFPHGGFPNVLARTRAVGIYRGSKHKDLAKYFLAFLAGEEYNNLIVADADALPPNPKYVHDEAYRHPGGRSNERDFHQPFADAAETIAITASYSPFILPSAVNRIEWDEISAFMGGLSSAEQAARRSAERINEQIRFTLSENPKLQPMYDQRAADQKTIEQLRAQGKKVSLLLIKNPFHRQYYQARGWAE